MDIATRIMLRASKENGEPTLPLAGAILNEAHARGASLRQLETACNAAIGLVREYAESTPMRELQSEGKPAFERILEDLGTLLN